ncbi:hypothetical protein HQN86_00445 [Pedobacter panaciterrae]|uniref:hypothetical protein n=1 Tax=Pedobacter panaciterrae TaxID=363849 RepID=UPI00155DC88C|nr:hypothetical protein [Pedobacter panaciterrae]NQX52071.1 hypothetical protein [Pedobacter panaciterrae]
MNTKKPLVYILGILVLGIWGLVLYQIFLSGGDSVDMDAIVQNDRPADKTVLPKLYPDTFKLLPEYPDPFTGERSKLPDTIKRLTARQRIDAIPVTPFPDPVKEMKYLGFVADSRGAHRVAIISCQGQDRMLKEGDTINKVKVKKIGKDAVMVSYMGKNRLLKTE